MSFYVTDPMVQQFNANIALIAQQTDFRLRGSIYEQQMKGEVLYSHTGWRGNPAKLVRRSAGEAADACEYRIAAE